MRNGFINKMMCMYMDMAMPMPMMCCACTTHSLPVLSVKKRFRTSLT